MNRFSIRGKVVDTSGKGVQNVKVSLDGEVKAVSDNDGYYALEKVSNHVYMI